MARGPHLRQQGSSLPKGARKQVEEGLAVARALGDEGELQTPPETGGDEVDEEDFEDEDEFEEDEDFGDEEFAPPVAPQPLTGTDALLFGPSKRAGEPLETGMPRGAGPDDIPLPNESPRQLVRRIAERLSTMPGASDDVKRWASRALRGG
jgi:hypothetical protein